MEEIGTEDAPKSALVLVVDKDCVRLLGDNRIHACAEHVRRVFLDVRFAARHLLQEMTLVATLTDDGGAIVWRSLLQVHTAKWLLLAPPEKEGNYFLHITVEHPTFGVREVTMPLELSA